MIIAVILAGTFGFSPVVATELEAQGAASSCDSVASVVAKGHLTRADWPAFLAVRQCGVVGAKAFAAGSAHYTAETDVEALDAYMHLVDNWRDSSIFGAVTRLATDRSASPEARVFAIRHLILLLEPNFLLSYAGLTRPADTTRHADGLIEWSISGCLARMISAPHGSLIGAPLPTDYEARIREILASLAGAPDTPAPVRTAAHCALTQWHSFAP